jgi:histidine triad (HIT) family protein
MPTSLPHTADCVFCAILRGGAPAAFIHQDDLVVAFMDIRPVQPGHVLVVPRIHAELIPDLDAASLTRLFPVGYGFNPPRTELEAIAGQIRHAHGS